LLLKNAEPSISYKIPSKQQNIQKWVYRCLFVWPSVCLSVGMFRADGNPNPCTDLAKILHAYPYLSKEGFGAGLTPAPSPIWAWGAGNPIS